MSLQNKKILIGISGSIAAYKIIHLVRLLVKQGAEVKVVMTAAAKDFVSPLVLSTLSKNEVLTDIFAANTWANHVQLGRWADVMLIAPLSCNTLAKMANGHCDNLLLSVYLSATCPVIAAPAMDEDMWHHPSTHRNLDLLKKDGVRIIQPGHGELASGLYGDGRMEEPENIMAFLNSYFKTEAGSLAGKKVLVTAGPTHEAIDPVRFIGNHSSGKMGIALAKECRNRGAEVILVLGPVALPAEYAGITVVKVTSSDEMYQACHDHFEKVDIALMAAAVADYKPETVSEQKIKKAGETTPELKLVKTKDILKSLGAIKSESQVLLGFALETNNEKVNALEKLKTKNADFIVLNSLNDGVTFGSDVNKVTIFTKWGTEIPFDSKSKTAVASDIINTIIDHSKTLSI
ncbi:bifunctional phosphopantothenoylcysteine decarboxylase/phosphopantothenate--cysteine ligase CoaBC [Niabella yanshanensis]|uniref:Coenzyme A biosynthesis bifunctional protein CoaBC n=1 Tax=Niabella yanshanensis TaxID=577386 RepID=A0ABZ0W3D7_9BACT|nr:bifunctional phosphopantothenoylcysteine decarboxylase/phosphopantothenate--cysteine ligase CoaBC [Niabella yanshanensis]WQD37636.1 bifunctional phosphopantothenoylcysteine decarboxylase/phosphopantothenate--cysteine ligase CoaBC [Niabella yanshanensis]